MFSQVSFPTFDIKISITFPLIQILEFGQTNLETIVYILGLCYSVGVKDVNNFATIEETTC